MRFMRKKIHCARFLLKFPRRWEGPIFFTILNLDHRKWKSIWSKSGKNIFFRSASPQKGSFTQKAIISAQPPPQKSPLIHGGMHHSFSSILIFNGDKIGELIECNEWIYVTGINFDSWKSSCEIVVGSSIAWFAHASRQDEISQLWLVNTWIKKLVSTLSKAEDANIWST